MTRITVTVDVDEDLLRRLRLAAGNSANWCAIITQTAPLGQLGDMTDMRQAATDVLALHHVLASALDAAAPTPAPDDEPVMCNHCGRDIEMLLDGFAHTTDEDDRECGGPNPPVPMT